MNFKLTEEQDLIRKNIREFCVKNVEPVAAEIDEKEAHPAELFSKLAEGGWMGIPIPTPYGGSGSDYLTHAIVVEELSRACSSTGFTVSIHVGIACMLINLFGTEEQKKKYLVPLATGQHLGAFVLTEPGAGTDVMAATTAAAKDGDAYVLNGKKHWITGGGVSRLHLIFARVFDEKGREEGIGGFIVEREPGRAEPKGLVIGKREPAMGLRGIPETEVHFENLEVPEAMCLKSPRGFAGGFGDLMDAYNAQRVGAGTVALGLAQGAFEAVLVIDRLAQIRSVGGIAHLDRGIASLGYTGGGARLGVGEFGGRVEARCRPELFVKLAILGLEATELHALEQGQAPGGDRKGHQQPDHRAFDGFKWRCQCHDVFPLRR